MNTTEKWARNSAMVTGPWWPFVNCPEILSPFRRQVDSDRRLVLRSCRSAKIDTSNDHLRWRKRDNLTDLLLKKWWNGEDCAEHWGLMMFVSKYSWFKALFLVGVIMLLTFNTSCVSICWDISSFVVVNYGELKSGTALPSGNGSREVWSYWAMAAETLFMAKREVILLNVPYQAIYCSCFFPSTFAHLETRTPTKNNSIKDCQ